MKSDEAPDYNAIADAVYDEWQHDLQTNELNDKLIKLEEENKILKDCLLILQSRCGYASPWWIEIETILNPGNPVLKDNE